MIEDTKELRYGNILWHELFKKHVTVRTLSIGTINGLSLKYIQPILITKKALQYNGWIAEDMADLGIYTYYKISDEISLNFENTIWIEQYDTGIKYIHQLQNLYWCLVGKELEITI